MPLTGSIRRYLPVLLIAAGVGLQSCSGPQVNLSRPSAASTTDSGIYHTLGGVSYKTFDSSIDDLRAASEMALKRMEIDVTERNKREDGQLIRAMAADRDIQILLEPLSPGSSRMRVVAKQGVTLRDAATSTEIILETGQALAERVAQRENGD